MKKTYIITVLLSLVFLIGCDQAIARNWGGHIDIKLPECHRLITATWKEANIWYLTEPMGDNKPRTTVFRESSVYGAMQGSISFLESCQKEQQ